MLRCIAHLLELDEEETRQALCSRVVAARGEVMQKGHNIEQAKMGRDAFAKVRSYIEVIKAGSLLPR